MGEILIAGHMLIPILGLLWLAKRREVQRQQRILDDSLKALQLLFLAQGRRR